MANSEKKYILFSVAKQIWAIPLVTGCAFANCEQVAKIPGADKRIVGLSYQNGRLITVLDTVKIIQSGGSYEDAANTCLLFDYEKDSYALLIDKGLETVTANQTKNYINYKNNKINILDPEKIMRDLSLYGSQ